MNSKFRILIVVLLLMCFFGLRLWKIEERVNFSMDQGIFMLRAREIWMNKEITLLGPTASPVAVGRQFFQGPAIYYLLAVFGVIANWNPVYISWIIVFFGAVGMYFLFETIKQLSNEKNAFIGVTIYCFLPIAVKFSNYIWNPNLLMFLTPIFLYYFVYSFKNENKLVSILAGVLAGICLQFHFQFVPVLVISMVFVAYKKKNILLPYFAGIVLGYLPLIIFDVRNSFYNVKTMWLWVTSGGNSGIGFQWHYVLAYLIMMVVPISIVLGKLKNNLLILLAAIFMIVSTVSVVGQNSPVFSFAEQQKVVDWIVEDGCPANFNIAKTTDGDTRAYNLRYLLDLKNCIPRGVDQYPNSNILYLISPKERLPENETVWEISSVKKLKVVDKKEINSKLIYYELK